LNKTKTYIIVKVQQPTKQNNHILQLKYNNKIHQNLDISLVNLI